MPSPPLNPSTHHHTIHHPPVSDRSNRSAALLQLSKTTKAVADAEECIRLAPDWDKGYFRKAAALEALGRLEEVGAGLGGGGRALRAEWRRGGWALLGGGAWEGCCPAVQ